MSTRPRLIRSVPFLVLLVGSLASLAGGAYVLLDRLGGMDSRLTAGTATSNDVYVGQIWAVLGAILIGVGLIGLALSLTIGALSGLARTGSSAAPADAVQVDGAPVGHTPEERAEPTTADANDDLGYDHRLGYDGEPADEAEQAIPATR